MLFSIEITKKNEILVKGSEGTLRGREVMTCDQIRLTHVTFEGRTCLAWIQAVWGAVLPDWLNLDVHGARRLGIGQPFSTRPRYARPMTLDPYPQDDRSKVALRESSLIHLGLYEAWYVPPR